MDRIRKALDLARLERLERLERAQAFELGRTDSAPVPAPTAAPAAEASPAGTTEFHEAAAANASSAERANAGKRVFTPPAALLEQNRVLVPGSSDAAAVAFRMLRTQVLQRMDTKGWRTLAIFSPGPNDGKTTTAVNLAVSLGSDHLHTVLLVEFDFKRPTLAPRFGLTPELGSDDVLEGRAQVQDCLYQPTGFERFVLMPARGTLGNSSELLAGPRARAIVSELRARYPERIVLFDLPPVLSADDALSFAPLIECGLVVGAGRPTPPHDLVRTIELLHKTPLLGTVLNRAMDAPPGY